MAHADRYDHLIHLTGKKKADADYMAACYILSATIETTFQASSYISSEGIDFDALLEHGELSQTEKSLVQFAYNLFSWDRKPGISPFEISRLGYPFMALACNAVFISSGQYKVEVLENENDEKQLHLDDIPYRKAFKCYQEFDAVMDAVLEEISQEDPVGIER